MKTKIRSERESDDFLQIVKGFDKEKKGNQTGFNGRERCTRTDTGEEKNRR